MAFVGGTLQEMVSNSTEEGILKKLNDMHFFLTSLTKSVETGLKMPPAIPVLSQTRSPISKLDCLVL